MTVSKWNGYQSSIIGVRIKSNSEMEYHPAEREFIDALQSIVDKYGKLEDRDEKGIWVGYVSAKDNDNKSIGIKCSNCAHYESEKVCKIIKAKIEPDGYCRLAAIPSGKVKARKK